MDLPLPLILPYLQPLSLHCLCHVSLQFQKQTLDYRPAIYLLLKERKITFLPTQSTLVDLRTTVADILLTPEHPKGANLDLDQLHLLLPPEPPLWKKKGTLGVERWQRSFVATRWQQSGGQNSSKLMELYNTFIIEVITPLVQSCGETEFYYSKIPLLRTHFPAPPSLDSGGIDATTKKKSKRRGCKQPGVSTQRHTDGRYGHPSGEFNVWLPLSKKVWGSNSLHRDASPWSGELTSSPFVLEYGDVAIFYGNQIPHQTIPNNTDMTRCSLDFRIVPGSLFEENYHRPIYAESGKYYEKHVCCCTN